MNRPTCRWQGHQRFAPRIDTVLNKADGFLIVSPSLVAAVAKRCVHCAVLFCPIQQHPGTFPAGSVPPELRADAVFHDKALVALRCENHGHGKADVLPILMEEQEEATILRPAINLHHVIRIFRTEKIFRMLTIRIGEDVTLAADIKLLLKGNGVLFRDRVTKSDRGCWRITRKSSMLAEKAISSCMASRCWNPAF